MRQLPPPKEFGPEAREVWSVAQRQLRLQGTWTRSDAPLLEAYCHNVIAARHARTIADRYLHGSNLELRAALKMVADAEGAALALARSLLLTAESRRRHGIKPPSKSAEDELAQLVG